MAETRRLTLPVTGMTCANCVATVERSLKRVSGVQDAAVNLSSGVPPSNSTPPSYSFLT